MIVLDTNVVSELMRAAPAAAVLLWLRRHSDRQLVTTAVTVAEIRYGLARLPDGGRTLLLQRSAGELFETFAEQILPFDAAAAGAYAAITAERERAGRPISAFDAQIAGICRAFGASLATRNVRDFSGTGVDLLDPWQPATS